MNKICFLAISMFCILLTPKFNFSQCPDYTDATCNPDDVDYSNVVIGEVSGDSGQSDGTNDGIVEIVGPPGTVIGCMIITNTEWAVMVPAGTVIPADGVWSIGCLNGPGIQNDNGGVGLGGSNMAPNSPNGLHAGGNGDWNTGVPIDFDVCDPANFSYYDPAASGFTIDNTGNQGLTGDGGQVFLFTPNGTPHDGIYWDMGATGGPDHVSVTSNGNDYTLGDNDGNGVVNDVAVTVTGGRGDGGNATAVIVLPTGDGTECPCNTDASPGTFTVPAIGGANDQGLWFQWTLSDHVGCNSSFIRLDMGTSAGGIGGSPSHMDGEVDDATQDGMGQNLDNGSGAGVAGDFGETTITSEGFDPNGFTPTSCDLDHSEVAGQWAYTDHPTPGEPNDDPTFVFYANQTVFCNPGSVTLTAEVYNYQHVEELVTSTNQGNDKTGSYVVDENGTIVAWSSITVSGETTTLTWTSGVLPVGTHTFYTVIDDWTDCCGTTGNPHSQGTPNECYERESFTIIVTEPLMVTPTDIMCPGTAGFEAGEGMIDFSQFVTSSTSVEYILYDDGTQVDMNSSGNFVISSEYTNVTVEVVDIHGCSTSQTINISDDCRMAPPCPEITGSTDNDDDDMLCPQDEICFDITAFDNLPDGGTIDFYWDTNNTFNPYDMEGNYMDPASDCSSTPNGGDITFTSTTGPKEALYTLDFDTNNGPYSTSTPEFTDGSGDYFTSSDGSNISNDPTSPDGNYFGFQDIDGEGADPTQTLTIENIDISNCSNLMFSIDLASTLNGWDYDNSGDVDFFQVEIDAGSGNELLLLVTGDADEADGTNTNAAIDTDGDMTNGAEGASLTSSFQTFMGNIVATGTTATITITMDANSGSEGLFWDNLVISGECDVMQTTVEQFCYTFKEEFCNQGDIFVKAIINPFTEFSTPTSCLETDAERFELFGPFTMNCPDAELVITSIDQCVGDGMATIDVLLNHVPASDFYCLTYVDETGANQTVSVSSDGTTDQTYQIMIPDADTNGEVKITLVSVFADSDGDCTATDGCEGTVNDNDEVCVNIRPLPSGTPSASADATTCSPGCDGSVTFTFTGSGPFDFEYTKDGGAPIAVSGVSSPYTVTDLCPGEYDLSSVIDAAGCEGTLTSNPQTIDGPAANNTLLVTAQPSAVCGDGSETIDLTSDVTYDPAYNASDFYFFCSDPNTLPIDPQDPATFTGFLKSSTTITVTENENVYVHYLDPTTGCPSTTVVMIVADNSLCSSCPTIGSLADPADICEGEDFDLTASGLADMAMADNGTADYGIDFVHYGAGNTSTTTGNAYMGGTSLGTVAFGALTGTDPNQMAAIMNVGSSLTSGTYEICAILSPTPDATCQVSQCVTVEILENPTATDPNIMVCTPDASMYDLTAHDSEVGTGTVTWYDGDPDAGGTLISPATSVDLTTITDLFAVLTGANTCTASIDVSLTIHPEVVANNASLAACGDANGMFTFNLADAEDPTSMTNMASGMGQDVDNGASGVTVTYHSTMMDAEDDMNPITTLQVTAGTDQTVFVRVENSSNGCYGTAQVDMTVHALPMPMATNSGPTCGVTDIDLMETVGGFDSYSWTSSGSASIDDMTMQNTSASNASDNEVFTVLVTDANGCTNSASTTVEINDNPTSELVLDQSICNSETSASFTVTANPASGGALTYQWQISTDNGATWNNAVSTGNMTNTLTVTAPELVDGNLFQVIITEDATCTITSNSAELHITNVDCNSFPWNGDN